MSQYVLRQYLSKTHTGALLHKIGTIQECTAELAKMCRDANRTLTVQQLMDYGFRIEPATVHTPKQNTPPSIPSYEDVDTSAELACA